MVIPTREECEENDRLATEIEVAVNILLGEASEEAYYAICNLLEEEKSAYISKKNARIYILKIIGIILHTELHKDVKPNICEGRNTEELIVLYRKAILLFRRIEFDFPQEYKLELYQLYITERISMIALLGMIQSCRYIVDKEKVINEMIEIINLGVDNV